MVEADLRIHAGVDLRDLWRGTLTLRQLRGLINALPEETQTRRRISGIPEQYDGWSNNDLVTARLYDLVSVMHWQWLRSLNVEGVPDEPPPSILPTGSKPERDSESDSIRVVSARDAAGFMTATGAELFGDT